MTRWGEIKCPRCEMLEEHLCLTEEKLAKAVGHLLGAAEQLDGYVGYGYGDEFREAAAELTGGKDA